MATTSSSSSGLLHLTILGPREKRAPLAISPQSTIRELLREIDGLFPEFRHQRIRLLYGGRIVADDVKTLAEHRFTDGTAVHLHVTSAPRDPATAASLAAAGRQARVALAGSTSEEATSGVAGVVAGSRPAAGAASPVGSDGEGDPELAVGGAAAIAVAGAAPRAAGDIAVGDAAGAAAAPAVVVVGFDRLAALGLDADEIGVVRAQFLPDVTREMSAAVPLLPGEAETDRLRRMEDAWMRAQGPFSEFAMNLRPIVLARHGMGGPGAEEAGAAAVDRARFLDALRAERVAGARRAGRGGDDDDDDEEDEPRPGRAPVGTIWALLGGAVVGSLFGFLSL